jgi:hypothetical protein
MLIQVLFFTSVQGMQRFRARSLDFTPKSSLADTPSFELVLITKILEVGVSPVMSPVIRVPVKRGSK